MSTDFTNASPMLITEGLGTLADLGRLLVLVNLIDVVSTGAEPWGLLVAATMQRSDTEEEFDNLLDGVIDTCDEFGVTLLGGDTKLGQARALNATCLGTLRAGRPPLLRSNAVSGDGVWLTGPIGGCAGAIVLHSFHAGEPDDIAKAIARPELVREIVDLLVKAPLFHACTDVSDGLIADLHAIARASNCGITIDPSAIPLSPLAVQAADVAGLSGASVACSIGGDLQLIVVAPEADSSRLALAGCTRIGTVSEGSGVFARDAPSGSRPLQFQGHQDARGVSFADEVLEIARINAFAAS